MSAQKAADLLTILKPDFSDEANVKGALEAVELALSTPEGGRLYEPDHFMGLLSDMNGVSRPMYPVYACAYDCCAYQTGISRFDHLTLRQGRILLAYAAGHRDEVFVRASAHFIKTESRL